MTANTELICKAVDSEINSNLECASQYLHWVFHPSAIDGAEDQKEALIYAYVKLKTTKMLSVEYCRLPREEAQEFHNRLSQLMEACLLLSAEINGEVI